MKSDNMFAKANNNIEHLPLVLSPKDIAAILDVSRNTTYWVLHSKGFPAIKVGKQYRIPRDKFLAWLNSVSKIDVA